MTPDDIFAELASLATDRSAPAMPVPATAPPLPWHRREFSKPIQWTLVTFLFLALLAFGVLTADRSPKNMWGDKARSCDLMADGSHFQPC